MKGITMKTLATWRMSNNDLRWRKHPDGGLYAEVPAGQYRIVKHEVKGYGPKYNGYEVTTPMTEPGRWGHTMSQASAKWLAQQHFNRHYAQPT